MLKDPEKRKIYDQVGAAVGRTPPREDEAACTKSAALGITCFWTSGRVLAWMHVNGEYRWQMHSYLYMMCILVQKVCGCDHAHGMFVGPDCASPCS